MNKLNIRYVSDLHIEICPFILPYEENESDSILVIAGDICIADRVGKYADMFFKDVCNRFRKIIYVPGNHEYYGGSLEKSISVLKEYMKSFPNIHVLDKESMMIDEVAFIGATLWTDMFGNSDKAKADVSSIINDYHVIHLEDQGEACTPDDTIKIHHEHKQFIFDEIKKFRDEGVDKIVIISHHAPSFLSIHPKWAGNNVNAAFSSNLFNEVLEYQPTLWFHGHMHDNMSYDIGSTKVICNPRGYSKIISLANWIKLIDHSADMSLNEIGVLDYHNTFKQENVKFDPWASVEI